MSQINLHVDKECEAALRRLMRARGFRSKSEAIRAAIREGAERATGGASGEELAGWLGAGNRAPRNPRPRFKSDHDLWR